MWCVASAHPRGLATVSDTTLGSIVLDRRPPSGATSGTLSEPISGGVTGAPVASEAVRRLVSTPATDHIFFHILLALRSGQLRDSVVGHIAVGPRDTLRTPIFARCPGVNTDACRVMLRTLAGMEDFARTNAHFSGGIRTPRYDTAFVRGSAYIVFSICRTNVWIRNDMLFWTAH